MVPKRLRAWYAFRERGATRAPAEHDKFRVPVLESSGMTSQEQKFQELILLVARECRDDPRCGATKLNKILFYADFLAYEELGRSISGEAYRKLERGPVPRRILPILDGMLAEGWCTWTDRDYFGLPLRKLQPLREPELALFSAQEVELVGRVIRDLWELNAAEVSDLSHRFAGWQAAAPGEEIPYQTVFVDEPRRLTDEENEWAQEVIREYLGSADRPDSPV